MEVLKFDNRNATANDWKYDNATKTKHLSFTHHFAQKYSLKPIAFTHSSEVTYYAEFNVTENTSRGLRSYCNLLDVDTSSVHIEIIDMGGWLDKQDPELLQECNVFILHNP